MSSEPPSPLQVTFTPEFKRNLRQLAKKYRHIKSDLQPLLDQLASGNKPGDQVPQVHYEVFKVRAKNSNASKGKSGGYRLIYYVLRPSRYEPPAPGRWPPSFSCFLIDPRQRWKIIHEFAAGCASPFWW